MGDGGAGAGADRQATKRSDKARTSVRQGGMNSSSPGPAFGYLCCLEDDEHGLTGGLLVVSSTGRPLEFHCTAPVSASRAQEILFGPTLRPYLVGEQIGRALLQRSKVKPNVVLIDDLDATAAVGEQSTPLVYLSEKTDQAALRPASWMELEGLEPAVWAQAVETAELSEWLASLASSIDLAEPFERIGQAIREAQRLGQQREEPSQGGHPEVADRDAA